MNEWQEFIEESDDRPVGAGSTITQHPGEVVICFVNRYLAALDGVAPNVSSKMVVRKVLKTYKVEGRTEQHAQNSLIIPARPAPASASGPSPTANQGVSAIQNKDESGLPRTEVARPIPDKITKEQLKKIFPAAPLGRLQKITDELNRDLPKFKLDTPVRRAHFFGQVRMETGATAKGDAENFAYYTAKRYATESKPWRSPKLFQMPCW